MSDELNQEVDTEAQAAPEPTEAEQRARAQGWVPKDEWNGEGKWRDAEEYLDRGELFQKINSQRSKLRDLEENQKAFASHLKTVREAEFKRALATLRAEKKEALVEGDADGVIAADEKLIALQAEARRLAEQERQAPQVSNEPHPDFVQWQAKNPWYSDSNRAMKAFADVEGIKLSQQGLSPAEVLREIEAQVRKEFPEKFTNPNRSKPGAVEAGTRSGPSKAEAYQLSDSERKVMNTLVRSGTITKEQYIADLKAAKGEK